MQRIFLFRFTIFLLLAGNVFGQALSGTVVGTVTDQGGAVVPGANVSVTNEGWDPLESTCRHASLSIL